VEQPALPTAEYLATPFVIVRDAFSFRFGSNHAGLTLIEGPRGPSKC
jgi:hypothetical protein